MNKCKFPYKKKYFDVNQAYYDAKALNHKVAGSGMRDFKCGDHWHVGDIHKMNRINRNKRRARF